MELALVYHISHLSYIKECRVRNLKKEKKAVSAQEQAALRHRLHRRRSHLRAAG